LTAAFSKTWSESDHPRAEGGQFGSAGGASKATAILKEYGHKPPKLGQAGQSLTEDETTMAKHISPDNARHLKERAKHESALPSIAAALPKAVSREDYTSAREYMAALAGAKPVEPTRESVNAQIDKLLAKARAKHSDEWLNHAAEIEVAKSAMNREHPPGDNSDRSEALRAGIAEAAKQQPKDEKTKMARTFGKGWVTLQGGQHVFIDEATGHEKPGGPGGAPIAEKPGFSKPGQSFAKPATAEKPKEPEKRPAQKGPGDEPAQPGKLKNSSIPEEGRPEISKRSAQAISDYCGGDHHAMNSSLLDGKPLEGKSARVDAALAEAFKKVKPFKQPVTVHRGLGMSPEKQTAFLAAAKQSQANGTDFEMPAYSSTSTKQEWSKTFSNGVMLEIQAKKGLDLLPHGAEEEEQEFLLDKNSKFKVVGFGTAGNKQVVKLEQII